MFVMEQPMLPPPFHQRLSCPCHSHIDSLTQDLTRSVFAIVRKAGTIAFMTNTGDAAKYQPPSAFEALFNRTFGFLAGLGLAPNFIYLLEVRGRKSGKLFRCPVNLMEVAGKQILVAPRGRTQWVRNAEAANEILLKRASYRRSFALRPIADA